MPNGDDQQRKYMQMLQNLAGKGFPGAQLMTGPGAPPQQPPAAPQASGGTPPAAAAQPPPPQIPYPPPTTAPQPQTGSGIMGFLNNPLVMGALSGYFNAISTPRYAGRGTAIARGGLGFLSGMGEAEKALSEQEKSKLDEIKERQEIDAENKYQVSLERYNQGTAQSGDIARLKAGEMWKYQQEREDTKTANQVTGTIFQQTHPGQLGALIGGAIQRSPKPVSDTEAIAMYDEALESPYKAREIIQKLEKGDLDIARVRQEIAASQATAAEAAAKAPGEKAESDIATEEARIFKGEPEEVKRKIVEHKLAGGAEKITEWVDVDAKGNIVNHYTGSADATPSIPAKGERGWMTIDDYGKEGRAEGARAREHLEQYQNPKDPTDIKTYDLNKGERPPEGWPKYRPGAAGRPNYTNFYDPDNPSQQKTIDVNKEAPPPGWIKGRPPKEPSAVDVMKKGADTTQKITKWYNTYVDGEPTNWWMPGFKDRHARWAAKFVAYSRNRIGWDPIANQPMPGRTPKLPEAPAATATPTGTPTATESPTPTVTGTPAATPSAAATAGVPTLPPGWSWSIHDGKIFKVDTEGKEHYWADDPGPEASPTPPS